MLKSKIQNIISLYLCRYKNVQNFFIAHRNDINADDFSSDRQFYDIDNIDDFNDICQKYSFTVTDADAVMRFRQGDHFCLTAQDGTYGCWGWYTTLPRDFYVLEIDSHSEIPENARVLYHFFANPAQRRKGFYYDILRLIAAADGKDYSIIYAYDTNTASKNAIKKAGFKDLGEMNRKTFCGFENMIKTYSE